MVWISNRIWNQEAQPFEFGQMATILSKIIHNPDENDQFSNGWDHNFCCSFEKWTIGNWILKSPDIKCFWILIDQISDPPVLAV